MTVELYMCVGYVGEVHIRHRTGQGPWAALQGAKGRWTQWRHSFRHNKLPVMLGESLGHLVDSETGLGSDCDVTW